MKQKQAVMNIMMDCLEAYRENWGSLYGMYYALYAQEWQFESKGFFHKITDFLVAAYSWFCVEKAEPIRQLQAWYDRVDALPEDGISAEDKQALFKVIVSSYDDPINEHASLCVRLLLTEIFNHQDIVELGDASGHTAFLENKYHPSKAFVAAESFAMLSERSMYLSDMPDDALYHLMIQCRDEDLLICRKLNKRFNFIATQTLLRRSGLLPARFVVMRHHCGQALQAFSVNALEVQSAAPVVNTQFSQLMQSLWVIIKARGHHENILESICVFYENWCHELQRFNSDNARIPQEVIDNNFLGLVCVVIQILHENGYCSLVGELNRFLGLLPENLSNEQFHKLYNEMRVVLRLLSPESVAELLLPINLHEGDACSALGRIASSARLFQGESSVQMQFVLHCLRESDFKSFDAKWAFGFLVRSQKTISTKVLDALLLAVSRGQDDAFRILSRCMPRLKGNPRLQDVRNVILQHVYHADYSMRLAAQEALVALLALDQADYHLKLVLSQCVSRDQFVRKSALTAFNTMQPEHVKAVLQDCQDEFSVTREVSKETLAKISAYINTIPDYLMLESTEILSDDNSEVNILGYELEKLQQLLPDLKNQDTSNLVAALNIRFSHENVMVRIRSFYVYAGLTAEKCIMPVSIVQAVCQNLQNLDHHTRDVLKMLIDMVPKLKYIPQAIVSDVDALIQDGHGNAELQALEALTAFALTLNDIPDVVIVRVQGILAFQNMFIKEQAIVTLEAFGCRHSEMVQRVVPLLQDRCQVDPDALVRNRALQAYSLFAVRAKGAIRHPGGNDLTPQSMMASVISRMVASAN